MSLQHVQVVYLKGPQDSFWGRVKVNVVTGLIVMGILWVLEQIFS